jgi:predicted metal-dependent hydrolase
VPEAPRQRNPRLLSEEELVERRPVLLDGVAQFNEGYFFEAHETWEDLWYLSPVPARTYLQGLIQIAAGLVHFVRSEYPGTVRLLRAGLAKLEDCPNDFLGLDIARLRSETVRTCDEIKNLGSERFREWDRSRAPRIRFIDDAPRSR